MLVGKVIADTVNTLNESPSEKEGKFRRPVQERDGGWPSMKVPPKRKGNSLFPPTSAP